jgi:DNA polymerase-3 subunit chi
MTRVDFYVAESASRLDRYQVACRVAYKAWQAGHRVLLHTTVSDEVHHLDRLLWIAQDISFIPHGILGQADPAQNPILIGDGNLSDPLAEHDVLINLAADVPLFFSRFARLAECVDQDPQIKQDSRERYRFYRDRGYPLHMHHLGARAR